ncbi:MAG: hypothetical protein Q4C47_01905, partial [Planctomycetia bacterium]|nr:hypothetical protein [Planctomycetia bacterium]
MREYSMTRIAVVWLCLIVSVTMTTKEKIFAQETIAEKIGVRPYEMDRAGRTVNPVTPLVDFETSDGNDRMNGWNVVVDNAVGSFSITREQQLWGKYVGKITYRVVEKGRRTSVTLVPPEPEPIPENCDSVQIWGYGNNWAWTPDASTPCTTIFIHVKASDGNTYPVNVGYVNWKEWFLMVKRFTPEQKKLFAEGATLVGIEVSGGQNTEDRVLYFDDLAFYNEPREPLSFDPRPQRNLLPQPAMIVGNNVDPEKTLPFPTREATILPINHDDSAIVTVHPENTENHGENTPVLMGIYRSETRDLTMKWTYIPGDLPSTIVCEYSDGRAGTDGTFSLIPMAESEILFDGKVPDEMVPVSSEWIDLPPELVEERSDRATRALRCVWKAKVGEKEYDVIRTITILGKSLVIDLVVPQPGVTEVHFGKLVLTRAPENVMEPEVVTVPFLVGDYGARPGVAVVGSAEYPLFVTGFADHTRSNSSAFFFRNDVRKNEEDGRTYITYNGGTRYTARTDGTLNPCYERFFVTISDQFDEVLPVIPNPKSPWIDVTGERVWIAHGASMNRENDYAIWKRFHRYGMEKILVTDHEVGWRDGGESFTFRTEAAPGKGGDENQAWYAKAVQDLGYRYGIYNNYTDFAPVNAFWSEDMITRTPDGNLRGAWARCYNPKPARSVEYEARLAPIIQEKFRLSTAYCDVHTAVRPWDYVDFDPRVPGAGAFSSTFYSYGEIMLHQKSTWG